MIHISDKAKCCGCLACVNACPAQCIVPRRDREGFNYPVANPDLCINCGKCEKVCPVQNPMEPREPIQAYAARSSASTTTTAKAANTTSTARTANTANSANAVTSARTSSGGIFPLLATKFIDEGGVVYGAAFSPDLTVEHIEVTDKEGLEKLKGSKYVQSELYSAYEEIRDYLQDNKKVMFTGTPCQIAGLKKYLGNQTEGLFTVEVACHGVPSPGLWEKYIKAFEETHRCKIKSVNFRDKSQSWRHYDVVYEVEKTESASKERSTVRVSAEDEIFISLFRQDMTLRPSCYNCPARNGRSGSDITLADLWSVHKVAPHMDDDKGASLVLLNSERGKALFETLEIEEICKVDPSEAMTENGGFATAVQMPQKREEFFKGVHSTKNLLKYMKGYVIRTPLHKKIYRKIRRTLSKMKRRLIK